MYQNCLGIRASAILKGAAITELVCSTLEITSIDNIRFVFQVNGKTWVLGFNEFPSTLQSYSSSVSSSFNDKPIELQLLAGNFSNAQLAALTRRISTLRFHGAYCLEGLVNTPHEFIPQGIAKSFDISSLGARLELFKQKGMEKVWNGVIQVRISYPPDQYGNIRAALIGTQVCHGLPVLVTMAGDKPSCYVCLSTGHIAKDCPTKQEKEKTDASQMAKSLASIVKANIEEANVMEIVDEDDDRDGRLVINEEEQSRSVVSSTSVTTASNIPRSIDLTAVTQTVSKASASSDTNTNGSIGLSAAANTPSLPQPPTLLSLEQFKLPRPPLNPLDYQNSNTVNNGKQNKAKVQLNQAKGSGSQQDNLSGQKSRHNSTTSSGRSTPTGGLKRSSSNQLNLDRNVKSNIDIDIV
jgi:hypothetical protein